MRKLMLPAAAAAALAFVALDSTPAQAQVVTSYYFSPGSYGGYSPYSYGGSGIVIGNGGIGLGMYPAYSGFGYPSDGYSPYYGGGYRSNYGGGYNPYYGGGYRSNYGGGYGYPRYSVGYRGVRRR
jgi:hypothetical protein